jgi:hypothetical protein
MDVITIRANNTVSLVQKLDEAGGDSLLAVVKVDETKHLATVVHLCAHVLKYTAKNHVLIHLQCLFPCNSLEKMTDSELQTQHSVRQLEQTCSNGKPNKKFSMSKHY